MMHVQGRNHRCGSSARRARWAPRFAVLGGIFFLKGIVLYTVPRIGRLDFAIYYDALRRAAQGGSLYAPSERGIAANWHPPHFHLVLWPFVQLGSLERAGAAWVFASALVLAAAVFLVTRWVPIAEDDRRWLWALLAWAAPFHVLLGGQTVAAILVPLLLAWRGAHQRRQVATGFWLATAVLIKPFLAPLWLWPLRNRQWRVFAVGAGTVAAWLTLGGVVFGWESVPEWVHQVQGPVPWAAHWLNSSVATLLVPPGANPLSSWPWRACALALLGSTAWIVWRRVPDLDQAWFMLVLAGLLASPLAWVYYWWFLLPMAVTMLQGPRRRWSLVLGIGALFPLDLAAHVRIAYVLILSSVWVLAVLTVMSRLGSGARGDTISPAHMATAPHV